jgi:lipid-binding SYLF domain-containing protein
MLMNARLRPASRGAESDANTSPVEELATGSFPAGRRRKGLEFGLLALVIAVAAGIIWGVIELAFPRGSGLPEVTRTLPDTAPPLSMQPTVPADDFEGVVATIRRKVQMRLGSQLAWTDATVGRALHTQDGIQTLEGASAVVKVRGQGDVTIGENSLVVFEPNNSDPFFAARGTVATVDHGELTGSLVANADREALGLRLPHAAIRLQGARTGQPADFRLQVGRDRSAAVVILRGRAQVRAANGTRKLASGEGIRISADGRNVETRSIPPVPVLMEPAADQVIVYSRNKPAVVFRWQVHQPTEDYHMLVAEDPEFRQVLVDQRLGEASFTHPGLKTGQYFWKVSGRSGWLESAASAPAGFRVERDIDAKVREALTALYERSREARDLVAKAQGVLVFPNVIKAGLVIGGEYGQGALVAAGRTVDYYSLKSASLGLQLGGETRKIALLFMTREAYDDFVKSNGWKVGVDGSVTLAALGIDKTIDKDTAEQPIIGFVFANKGLMSTLSLEGSKIARVPD